MASNIAPDEDEPMHPAGLDMTRGSLQDILDGNDVNVSTALPTVPQDTTNPFINPNQTLADIIPDRNLGPLASLKITDADLIILSGYHADTPITIKAEPFIWPTAAFINIHEHPL